MIHRVPAMCALLCLLLAAGGCSREHAPKQPDKNMVDKPVVKPVAKAIAKPIAKSATSAPVEPVAKPKAAAGAKPIVVQVYHDTVCPWCRIGCANLSAALKDWKGPPVQIVYRPFLLNPNAPAEGQDLRAHLADKYGAARVEKMFKRVTEVGARSGVTFAFDKVKRAPDSRLSHALIEWVPLARKRAVIDAVQTAYFERGADIGNVDVLVELAESAGIDAAAARAHLEKPGRRHAVGILVGSRPADINGVPHFIIDGQRRFQGAQPAQRLRQALDEAAARRRSAGS